MNRTLKRIITYVRMTLLFMVLGFAVLYIGGTPIASYVIAHANMAMVQGAPGLGETAAALPNLVIDMNNASDLSEIQAPAPDTQYAEISCDRIELAAPVYYGDSDTSLQNGVGQYPQSALPGQGKPIMLSGHDSTFFAPLEKIKMGDIVKLTTGYGEFSYRVTDKIIADSKDTTAYDLTQDKEQLILYTCYPFGQLVGSRSNRFFVFCDRIYDTEDTAQ